MDYLILALATWRISAILVYEDGPFMVFERLRLWAEIELAELSKLLACLWCLSVWVGLPWSVLYAVDRRAIYLALPFALSAGGIFLDEAVNRIKVYGPS